MKTKLITLLLLQFMAMATFAGNVITYTASAKLPTGTGYDDHGHYVYKPGLHANAFNVSISSHTFSEGIGNITFNGDVTSIGSHAFYGCTSLTSITIPNSVTNVGEQAFSNCSSLTSVAIGNSVTSIGSEAFRGCSGLTSVTIPNSVTSIESSAFWGCSGLTSITIPNSVTSIGSSAFYECTNLTSLTIPNGVIGQSAFYGCFGLTSVIIGNSVTSIESLAFYGCSGLTSVTIPNSVTSVASWAFRGCASLTSITVEIGNPVYDSRNNCNAIIETASNKLFIGCASTVIPNSVTSIGYHAFSDCSGLTSITIPNSVTSIGDYAFYGCSGLTSITIPNSVTSIGSDAFYGCTELKTVYNQSTLKFYKNNTGNGYVGYYADVIYEGVPVGDFIIKNDTLLTKYVGIGGDVTIPNNVTKIGGSVFEGCSALTSVTIPKSVTSIGWYAFRGCTSLTSITIPNSLTSIGESAFEDCSSLTSVTIPESVTSIGDWAFYNCTGLTDVYMKGELPASFSSYTFYRVGCTIHVPCQATTAYKTQCNAYSYVEPLPDYEIDVQINSNQGSIYWIKRNSCTNIVEFEAKPYIGCSFVQWSDGVTDNPRTVELTQDSMFTAEMALFYDGVCGDSLTWKYSKGVLTIHGTGDMYGFSYSSAPWINFRDSITKVVLPDGLTKIGNYAFYNCKGFSSIVIPNSVTYIGYDAFSGCAALTSITIPNSVTNIGEYAFSGCSNLTTVSLGNGLTSIGRYAFDGCSKLRYITSLAEYAPTASSNTFPSYNAILKVPCDVMIFYQGDDIWGQFKYIQCIEAEEAVVTTTTVVPAETDATFAWPTSEGANTYTLKITKDGVVFCTLTFNANGQLLNIAFAPGRDGAAHAPEAELTATGYQFTVTGLESGSTYAYTLDAKDASNNVVANYSGTFTTTGGEMGVESVNKYVNTPTKVVREGQVLILRGDRLYDLRGQEVK